MASFKDNSGNSWKTLVNVTTVRRVKDLTGVYLPGLVEDSFKSFNALAEDVIQLVDVLYAVCQPDAESNRITPEQFGEGLYGDPLGNATVALVEGIIDFFPDARKRAMLRQILEKSKVVRSRLLDRSEIELGKVDPDKIADDLIAQANRSATGSSDLSGSVPESSESTPVPSP